MKTSGKKLVKYLRKHQDSRESDILHRLMENVVEGNPGFGLQELYELDYEAFDLALTFIRDWRLDRYSMGSPASQRSYQEIKRIQ